MANKYLIEKDFMNCVHLKRSFNRPGIKSMTVVKVWVGCVMSEALQKGPAVRLAMVGVATMLLGGCADFSRMGDPFADPFRTSSSRYDRSPTGSTTQAPPQSQGSNFFAETFRPFDDHPAPAPQPTRAPDYERPHVAPPMAVQSQPLAPL